MISVDEALSRPPAPGAERIYYSAEPSHFGDLRCPDGVGPFPIATVLHGGCWRSIANLHYMDGVAEWIRSIGWASWNVEFPTLPDPASGWPGLLSSVGSAADYVHHLALDHPIEPSIHVTVGHSSGGHLALWLAARSQLRAGPLRGRKPSPITGVVSLAGIPDLAAFDRLPERACGDAVQGLLGGGVEEQPDRLRAASPSAHLPLGVPQLLLTGELDPDVPADFVHDYAEEARAHGDRVEEIVVAGVGHFEPVAPWGVAWGRIGPRITSFLASLRS